MATVKTAISMPERLFEDLEAAAKEMQLSRSQVFAQAVKEFLRERENRRILEQLNQVYAEGPDEEEQQYLERMKARYRRIIEGEW